MTGTVLSRVWLSDELLVWRDGGRTKLREEGRCRLCERDAHMRPLTRHHLVPRSYCRRRAFSVVRNGHQSPAVESLVMRHLLRDADANIVPLCSPCHRAIEGDSEARKMLRRSLAPQEVAFVVAVRGAGWFERIYPPRPADGRSTIPHVNEREETDVPKPVKTVDYNHEGAWAFALVTGTGEGGPGNLNLLVKTPGEGGWEEHNNVPQGDASGHWREGD